MSGVLLQILWLSHQKNPLAETHGDGPKGEASKEQKLFSLYALVIGGEVKPIFLLTPILTILASSLLTSVFGADCLKGTDSHARGRNGSIWPPARLGALTACAHDDLKREGDVEA